MIRVKEKVPSATAIQVDTSSEENLRSIVNLLGIESIIINELSSVERFIRNQLNSSTLSVYIPALRERVSINNGNYIIVEDDTHLVWAVTPEDFNRVYETIE